MDIPNLLNPEPSARVLRHSSLATRPGRMIDEDDSPEFIPAPQSSKKKQLKIAKDAAKFEKGMTTGQVRFPPHHTQDEDLKRTHEKLQVFPRTGIDEFPRHIPYSSDKKTFQISTGRHSFEVFQYKFKYRDAGKDWVVMWDYNIGLVRVTPFFKALGFVKTVPAKAIAMSPGLKEMCYSITGGSIAAQGYWIPFEAAKALATTFCWQIRHALTPIFGNDFPDLCLTPEDPAFKRFSIEPEIVRRCKEEALTWRLAAGIPDSISGASTPIVPFPLDIAEYKSFSGSSDGSEASHSDEVYSCPRRQSRWTAVNQSHSPNPTSGSTSPDRCLSRVPTSPVLRTECVAAKRALEDTGDDADESSVAWSDSNAGNDKRRKVGKYSAEEICAAHVLLQISRGAGA